MKNFLLLLLLFSSVLPMHAMAQADEHLLVSGDFNNLSFDRFVQQIEASYPFHFYYNTSVTDSLTVTISVKEKKLSEVLDFIFSGRDLHYAIDAQNRVFITQGESIRMSLPLSFFERGVDTAIAPAEKAKELVYDQAKSKKEAPPEISVENKLFEIGQKTNHLKSGKSNIAGYVRDGKTGEAIIGAYIFTEDKNIGVVTDKYGYYSMTLPRGRHTLYIKAFGMYDTQRKVMLYSDGKLSIDLHVKVLALKEVVVEAEKEKNVKSTQMGKIKLNINTLKQIPAVFGETDILRAVLALPGVQSVGEASTGFNVRGGATDQNLVLLNDATIYNPTHLFGFFSAFNPDVVKDVTLYKSGIPARYGGRLSSVLDVTMLEGNKKKITGSAGIGPLTSKLTVEGPLFNDKTTFVLGGRTTYSDWILRSLPGEYKNSHASFYDITLHLTHKLNDKNSLYLTGYTSRDHFNLNSDTAYSYRNKNINLKWKHIFNNQFYGVLTAGYDGYEYKVVSDVNPVTAYKLGFDITQYKALADFSYFPNTRHTLNFGVSSIRYTIDPASLEPWGKKSLIVPDQPETEQALESALYLEDHYNISSKLSLDFGIRYSMFNYLGPKNVYTYPKGASREESNILDTLNYGAGKVIKTYQGPEWRLSARYSLTDNASLKVSYNSLQQYIHMLSNTAAISPTDIWKLSDPNIRPQQGDQVSLGFYKNYKSNTIETSVEVYYKRIRHYLDYKSGAVLLLNHHIETDVINTKEKAYGAELLIKKLTGKLNGWVSYTYSRALLRQDDPLVANQINHGMLYPANFDKPHDVNVIGNYRFSHRFSVSLNLKYSTGRPITLPIAIYDYGGGERVLYSDRNQYRIPDYFRMDVSMNIAGNHKIYQLAHNSWTLGVYNLTGRKNAYSIYFTANDGKIRGYKLSIFGNPIPFITYNIRF